MAEPDPKPPGLLTALGRLSSTLLTLVETRLELFAVELEEEQQRFLRVLLWSAASLFFSMLAVILITLAVVWACPAQARIYVLAGFCLVYLGSAVAAASILRWRLRNRPRPFAGSVDQLKRDAECFRPRS